MDKFFKLKENGTNVSTEFLAGLTTFFAMSYIIFVNPNILRKQGCHSKQSSYQRLLQQLSAH